MAKMVWVRNTKTGMERSMTKINFDYLSAKKRGFEFIRNMVEPGSIEEHKERLKAEKAVQENKTQDPGPAQNGSTVTQIAPPPVKAKPGPKPKVQTA